MTGENTATPQLLMVQADHLNRPLRLTDAARATVWTASYDPFGQPWQVTGTLDQNLRFPGQYYLIESGLSYNWHRVYDPATGRYTQPDPLRFVDGPSVYGYAGQSPMMREDPEGRQSIPLPVPLPIAPPVGLPPQLKERDKFGLPICSNPPEDPDGDCTPWMKRSLQADVEFYCLQPRACSASMGRSELGERMFINEQCARARDAVNRVRYRGGDRGHRGAAGDAWVTFAHCQALLSLKPY